MGAEAVVNWGDVAFTVVLMVVVILGFLYELAGETVPGWHTISWWAKRNPRVRRVILGAVLLLFIILKIHFGTLIGR